MLLSFVHPKESHPRKSLLAKNYRIIIHSAKNLKLGRFAPSNSRFFASFHDYPICNFLLFNYSMSVLCEERFNIGKNKAEFHTNKHYLIHLFYESIMCALLVSLTLQ